jgi:catabolite regulation protein CreA
MGLFFECIFGVELLLWKQAWDGAVIINDIDISSQVEDEVCLSRESCMFFSLAITEIYSKNYSDYLFFNFQSKMDKFSSNAPPI